MFRKSDSALMGVKFEDVNGMVLLAIGKIDDVNYRNENYLAFKSFTLEKGERLVGLNSYSGGPTYKWAQHHAVQFIIGAP
jgi:hypothetical protein